MFYFKRAFFVALWAVILVLILVLGFEAVNIAAEKSGFSSGNVFVFEAEDGYFSGEIFGESFFAYMDFFDRAEPVLKTAAIFLPPPIKFAVRIRNLFF